MINILFEEELGDPEDDINENHEIKTEYNKKTISIAPPADFLSA